MSDTVPGGEQPLLLRGGDRAVLGAVEVERPAAQQPAEQGDRRDGAGAEADPVRCVDERKRREYCDDQEEALAAARHAGALEQRSQRRREPDEPPRERNRAERARRLRHVTFADAAVGARVGPVVLADDHDTVRARHPTQPRAGGAIGELKLSEDGGLIHPAMIAIEEPPGKCRAAHHSERLGPSGLPVPAREEAEQREHEHHDENDPENAHASSCLPLGVDLAEKSPQKDNGKPSGRDTACPSWSPWWLSPVRLRSTALPVRHKSLTHFSAPLGEDGAWPAPKRLS